MKALILSAGLGTRLRPLTDHLPKVMVKIGAKPVLEHLVNLCIRHQVKDLVINLHFLPETITGYFGDGSRFGAKITYSYEPEIMGGAGALKQAERLLAGDSFFVLNGDVMTDVNLRKMAEFHQKKGGLGTFLAHPTDHPFDSDLIEYDDSFLITRFFRPKPGESFRPVSKTGTHIFSPAVLPFIPSGVEYSLERQLLPDLLKRGQKLYAFYSDCYSKDMGTPARLKQVQRDYEQGKIKV
jgi:NDP-sugar pyrophosphorylase family protein